MSSDVSSCVAAGSGLNYRLNKLLKVMVCAVTLVAFFVNIFAYDLAYAAETSKQSQSNFNNFSLPAYLGYIKESFKGNSDKVVFHIQDAHCNYAAQNAITGLIDYLNKEYDVNVINLEGGEGDYNLSPFAKIDDEALRREVADYFLKEGLINGAESYAINNPEKPYLWGVENTDLYLDNLKVYRDSIAHKTDIDRSLEAISSILNNLKSKVYSKKLFDIDQKSNDFKSRKIELKKYISYLNSFAVVENIPAKDLKNIAIVTNVFELEKRIDFKKSNADREQLIDKLTKSLSRNEREELVKKAVEFKLNHIIPAEFYNYLISKAEELELDLGAYTNLSGYIEYITLYAELKNEEMFKEIEYLEGRIKKKLYQNDPQRKLDDLSYKLDIIKKVFSVTLTADEFRSFSLNRKEFNLANFTEFIKSEAPRYGINIASLPGSSFINTRLAEIERFYELSHTRDLEFVKRMKFRPSLRGAPEGRRSNLKNVSILITGGFHTENLAKLLKEKNISYVSIMPNFGLDNKECPYFKLLADNGSIFGRYVRAGASTLAYYTYFCHGSAKVYGDVDSAGCISDVAGTVKRGELPTEASEALAEPRKAVPDGKIDQSSTTCFKESVILAASVSFSMFMIWLGLNTFTGLNLGVGTLITLNFAGLSGLLLTPLNNEVRTKESLSKIIFIEGLIWALAGGISVGSSMANVILNPYAVVAYFYLAVFGVLNSSNKISSFAWNGLIGGIFVSAIDQFFRNLVSHLTLFTATYDKIDAFYGLLNKIPMSGYSYPSSYNSISEGFMFVNLRHNPSSAFEINKTFIYNPILWIISFILLVSILFMASKIKRGDDIVREISSSSKRSNVFTNIFIPPVVWSATVTFVSIILVFALNFLNSSVGNDFVVIGHKSACNLADLCLFYAFPFVLTISFISASIGFILHKPKRIENTINEVPDAGSQGKSPAESEPSDNARASASGGEKLPPYISNTPQFITVTGDDGAYKYLNPSFLPDGSLLARCVREDIDTSKPHRSDIARLIPIDEKGLEFKFDRIIREDAEDPRVMDLGKHGSWLTYTVPSQDGGRWKGYFVRIAEDGAIAEKSESIKLGNPDINSKDAYIVILESGAAVLIDRANIPDKVPAIQFYRFNSLEEILERKDDYWKEHTVENSTIGILSENHQKGHIGFNTIAGKVKYKDKGGKEKKALLALIHRAVENGEKDKRYKTAVVLLNPETLDPLGVPVDLHILDGNFTGDVCGVIYETAARIEGDKLISYAGICDCKIARYEESVEAVVRAFFVGQQKTSHKSASGLAGEMAKESRQLTIKKETRLGKPIIVIPSTEAEFTRNYAEERLLSENSAWIGFMDMAKAGLRNTVYGHKVMDVVIEEVLAIVQKELWDNCRGIAFKISGDEIGLFIPPYMDAAEVRQTLIGIQQTLSDKFSDREIYIPFEPAGCVRLEGIQDEVGRGAPKDRLAKARALLTRNLRYAEIVQGYAKEDRYGVIELVKVVEDFQLPEQDEISILTDDEKAAIEKARKKMNLLKLFGFETEDEYPSLKRENLWEAVEMASRKRKPGVYFARGPPDSFYCIRAYGSGKVQVIKISSAYRALNKKTKSVFDRILRESGRQIRKRASDAVGYYGFKAAQDASRIYEKTGHERGNDWIKLENLGIYNTFGLVDVETQGRPLTDKEILDKLKPAATLINSRTIEKNHKKISFEVVFDASVVSSDDLPAKASAERMLPIIEGLDESRENALRKGFGEGSEPEMRDTNIGKTSPEVKPYAINMDRWNTIEAENEAARIAMTKRAEPDLAQANRILAESLKIAREGGIARSTSEEMAEPVIAEAETAASFISDSDRNLNTALDKLQKIDNGRQLEEFKRNILAGSQDVDIDNILERIEDIFGDGMYYQGYGLAYVASVIGGGRPCAETNITGETSKKFLESRGGEILRSQGFNIVFDQRINKNLYGFYHKAFIYNVRMVRDLINSKRPFLAEHLSSDAPVLIKTGMTDNEIETLMAHLLVTQDPLQGLFFGFPQGSVSMYMDPVKRREEGFSLSQFMERITGKKYLLKPFTGFITNERDIEESMNAALKAQEGWERALSVLENIQAAYLGDGSNGINGGEEGERLDGKVINMVPAYYADGRVHASGISDDSAGRASASGDAEKPFADPAIRSEIKRILIVDDNPRLGPAAYRISNMVSSFRNTFGKDIIIDYRGNEASSSLLECDVNIGKGAQDNQYDLVIASSLDGKGGIKDCKRCITFLQYKRSFIYREDGKEEKKYTTKSINRYESVLEFIEKMGMEKPSARRLSISDDEQNAVSQELNRVGIKEGAPFVLFNPSGEAFHSLTPKYFTKYWAVVVANIVQKTNRYVVMQIDDNTSAIYDYLEKHYGAEILNNVVIVKRDNAAFLKALIDKSDAVVTVDTSLYHIAYALNKPFFVFGMADQIFGFFPKDMQGVKVGFMNLGRKSPEELPDIENLKMMPEKAVEFLNKLFAGKDQLIVPDAVSEASGTSPKHSISTEKGIIVVDSKTGRIKFGEGGFIRPDFELWGVRHGETNANKINAFQGMVDNPLNEAGIEQAATAAKELFMQLGDKIRFGEKITILTSELGRAKDTAQAFIDLVKDKTGIVIKPVPSELLNEISFGIWDGKTESELDAAQLKLVKRYREGLDATIRPQMGQNFIDMIDLSCNLMSRLNSLYKNQTVVMFGHGTQISALRAAMGDRTLLDETGQVDWRANMMPNAKPVLLCRRASASGDSLLLAEPQLKKRNLYGKALRNLINDSTSESKRRLRLLAEIGPQVQDAVNGILLARGLIEKPNTVKIAIAPVGSTLKGYADKNSDLEFIMYILDGLSLKTLRIEGDARNEIFRKFKEVIQQKQREQHVGREIEIDKSIELIPPILNLSGISQGNVDTLESTDIRYLHYLFLPLAHGEARIIEKARSNIIDSIINRALIRYSVLPEVFWNDLARYHYEWILESGATEVTRKRHLKNWVSGWLAKHKIAAYPNLAARDELDKIMSVFNKIRRNEVGLPSLDVMRDIYERSEKDAMTLGGESVNLISEEGIVNAIMSLNEEGLLNDEDADVLMVNEIGRILGMGGEEIILLKKIVVETSKVSLDKYIEEYNGRFPESFQTFTNIIAGIIKKVDNLESKHLKRVLSNIEMITIAIPPSGRASASGKGVRIIVDDECKNIVSAEDLQAQMAQWDSGPENDIIKTAMGAEFDRIRHPFDDSGTVRAKYPEVETVVVPLSKLDDAIKSIRSGDKEYTDVFLSLVVNQTTMKIAAEYKECFRKLNDLFTEKNIGVRKGETTFIKEGEDYVVLSLIYDNPWDIAIEYDRAREIIGTIDSCVLGRHFLGPEGGDPYKEGFYAAASAISDIGANGGEPRELYMTIVNPVDNEEYMRVFRSGIHNAASSCGVKKVILEEEAQAVFGPMAITATVLGATRFEQLKLSNGITSGMNVYMVGFPGVEALNSYAKDIKYLRANLDPELRGAVIDAVKGKGAASDISDSLIKSVRNCMKFSSDPLKIEIDLNKVYEAFPRELRDKYGKKEIITGSLTGGDSYGLIVVTSEDLERIHSDITKIGEVKKVVGSESVIELKSSNIEDISEPHSRADQGDVSADRRAGWKKKQNRPHYPLSSPQAEEKMPPSGPRTSASGVKIDVSSLQDGQVITFGDKNYKVIPRTFDHGKARVRLVEEVETGRKLIIKVMENSDEGKICMSLKHPCHGKVYKVYEKEGVYLMPDYGTLTFKGYMRESVMSGMPLKEWLAARVNEVIWLYEALDEMHKKGVYHGDLKGKVSHILYKDNLPRIVDYHYGLSNPESETYSTYLDDLRSLAKEAQEISYDALVHADRNESIKADKDIQRLSVKLEEIRNWRSPYWNSGEIPHTAEDAINLLSEYLKSIGTERKMVPGLVSTVEAVSESAETALRGDVRDSASGVGTQALNDLQKYLLNESNSPDAIAKAIQIIELYSKGGKQILFESCGGNAEVAYAIAKGNKNIGIITTDLYDVSDGGEYGDWAKDFESGKLRAQKEPLENLVVLRADETIFKSLPSNCVDYVLLVAPIHLPVMLSDTGIKEAIKPSGKIIVKPYQYKDLYYGGSDTPPGEIFVEGYLFKNTNTSNMFGVDIDGVSQYRSGEPLFIWQKATGRDGARESASGMEEETEPSPLSSLSSRSETVPGTIGTAGRDDVRRESASGDVVGSRESGVVSHETGIQRDKDTMIQGAGRDSIRRSASGEDIVLIQQFEDSLKQKLIEFERICSLDRPDFWKEPKEIKSKYYSEVGRLQAEIVDFLVINMIGIEGGIGIEKMVCSKAQEWKNASISERDFVSYISKRFGSKFEHLDFNFYNRILNKKQLLYGDPHAYAYKGEETDFYHAAGSLLIDSILENGILPLNEIERRRLDTQEHRVTTGQGDNPGAVSLLFGFSISFANWVTRGSLIGYPVVFGVSKTGTEKTFLKDNVWPGDFKPWERLVQYVELVDITHIYVPAVAVEEVKAKLKARNINWIKVVNMEPDTRETVSEPEKVAGRDGVRRESASGERRLSDSQLSIIGLVPDRESIRKTLEPLAERVWANIVTKNDILSNIVSHSMHGEGKIYDSLYFYFDLSATDGMYIKIYFTNSKESGGQPVTPKVYRLTKDAKEQLIITTKIWDGFTNEDIYSIARILIEEYHQRDLKEALNPDQARIVRKLYPVLLERKIKIEPAVDYGQIKISTDRFEKEPQWEVPIFSESHASASGYDARKEILIGAFADIRELEKPVRVVIPVVRSDTAEGIAERAEFANMTANINDLLKKKGVVDSQISYYEVVPGDEKTTMTNYERAYRNATDKLSEDAHVFCYVPENIRSKVKDAPQTHYIQDALKDGLRPDIVMRLELAYYLAYYLRHPDSKDIEAYARERVMKLLTALSDISAEDVASLTENLKKIFEIDFTLNAHPYDYANFEKYRESNEAVLAAA